MLEDRHYMRSESSRTPWRDASMTLIIVSTVIFVIQSIVQFYTRFPIAEYLYLSLPGVARGFLWQFITYQFLHGDVVHLLLNMLVLFFFGRALEETMGSKGLLRLYLISGVGGGILHVMLAFLIPYFNNRVIGASGACLGLVAAFARLYPERPIGILFLPITIPAKNLLWFAIALAIFGIVVPVDHVGHAAHLGGIIAAVIYVWVVRGQVWTRWASVSETPRKRRELVNAPAARRTLWSRPKAPVEDLPPEEFISRQVDPILDKISAHGIHSLTERERKILEAARAKMAKK